MSAREDTAAHSISRLLDDLQLEPAARIRVLRAAAEMVHLEDATAAADDRAQLSSPQARDELRRAEGGALSARDFAQRLRMASPETIRLYRQNGQVFAWRKGRGEYLYPAWQIDNGQLLLGLGLVLSILRHRELAPLSIIRFFLTPSDQLDGRSPLELLRAKRVRAVTKYANDYADATAARASTLQSTV